MYGKFYRTVISGYLWTCNITSALHDWSQRLNKRYYKRRDKGYC